MIILTGYRYGSVQYLDEDDDDDEDDDNVDDESGGDELGDSSRVDSVVKAVRSLSLCFISLGFSTDLKKYNILFVFFKRIFIYNNSRNSLQ